MQDGLTDGHDHNHDGHSHDGHGHDGHGHSHGRLVIDQALEDSRQGVRALKVSLAGLAVTAVLQLAVAAVSGSVALLGDSLHNVADALTALPLWLAFSLGRRPANRRFTYGYGRAEDVAGIFVVLMIAASAVLAAWEAVDRLRHPQDVEHLGLVMAAAVIGMIGNEAVAAYRIRVGRRIGSASLVADGLHARTDGLTSLAVLVGALGVAAGWQWADPGVGLVISAAILLVLVQAARGVGERLMDAVDPELVDRAYAVMAAVDGVEEVNELRIRWLGHRLQAEVRMTVDRDLDVATAHEIGEQAERALMDELSLLSGALVHVNPCDHHVRAVAGPQPAEHHGEH
ncbi:MAG: cation diffusion facilitator family transporter [Actinomycetota bacterium]|nr:cation diffusion facilitator family transporter [Actinomycetota bacterium]